MSDGSGQNKEGQPDGDLSTTESTSDENIHEIGYQWFPWVMGIVVVTLWAGTGWFLHDDAHRGTFGDMFGGVNALFSGLAFVGVIYAILIQRQELKIQGRELVDTRLELREQNKTMQRQRFENTFFELLRLQIDITNSIEIELNQNKTIRGRECFKHFLNRLKEQYEHHLRADSLANIVSDTYETFYESHQNQVSHYYRSLYNLIRFVDRHVEMNDIEHPHLYTNLIRAQLSSNELLLLFYNCLSGHGKGMKRLVEKYSLLRTMPEDHLFESELLDLFDQSAFGK